MRKNMNLKFSIKYFLKLTDGIGQKKEKPSQKIHSYSTRSRYCGVVHQLVDYLLKEGINRVDKIQEKHIIQYFKELEGKSEKTIKIHAAALSKYFTILGRSDLLQATRDARGSIEARQKTDIEGFSDPEKVISSIRNETSRAIAEIQLRTGARIGDIKKIEITKSGIIRIKGSKGGRDREISLSKEVKERVEKCLSKINFRNWREIRKSYYNDLKQAVCKNKELYTGAHAFRANFAAARYEEYKQKLSEREAIQQVSQDLGHNREDISKYYIARGK